MKIIKKIGLGILIASALFIGAYFLLQSYNSGIDPIQLYQSHKTYTIVVFISIILIYVSATTHTRFTTWMTAAILFINFLGLASFFTQDILKISTIEFYTLTVLFLLALATTRIRNRIRFPLVVTIAIPFIIILLNHTLPLYPHSPDFQGFYNTQKTVLHVYIQDNQKTLQEAETKITIKSQDTEKIVNLIAPENILLTTSSTQISFSSKTGLQNSLAYISYPQGTILTIYPQSAITVENTGITIIQGKVNIYTQQNQSGYLVFTGYLTGITQNETGNIQTIIDEFTRQRNAYFTNEIGGDIMLNTTVDTFIRRYISIANSADKIMGRICSIDFLAHLESGNFCNFSSFDQNKLNYDAFHTYLEYQQNTTYEIATGSTQRIARDTQKGRDSTNIKARRDNINATIKSRIGKK